MVIIDLCFYRVLIAVVVTFALIIAVYECDYVPNMCWPVCCFVDVNDYVNSIATL
jgi:hypothetical protein